MIVACVLAAALQAGVEPAVLRGTVLDASSGAPVVEASVSGPRSAPIRTDALGRFALSVSVGDTLRVFRVGYRATAVAVDGGGDLVVRLSPVALPLERVAVLARADDERTGRLRAAVPVDELRAAGVRDAASAAARLPFVAARGTHGDVRLSMRGSRAEQVLVTLDGVPLNDPALGAADFADIPLAALGGIAVLPGSDPVAGGPGAVGGTVSLTSGDRPVFAASGGAYGRYDVEGAMRATASGGALRVGASAGGARNDFPFLNTAGAPPDTTERRVNNDERRRALFASAVLPRLQLLALASSMERGLVGGMNVRAYDHDRGLTRRALLRAAGAVRGTSLAASMRALDLRYRDGLHPESNADARTLSADADASRAVGRIVVRAGAGGDRLRAGGASRVGGATRARAFVSAAGGVSRGVARLSAGGRVDAVEASGVRPSGSVAGEVGGRRVLFARVSQAFRAPTLYDLYFASPQRLQPANVRPERVALDAELGARVAWARGEVSGSLFERRTHDAIVWFPGNFVFSPANVPLERARGAEARAELRADWWSASGWAGAYRTRISANPLVIPTPYAPVAAGGGALSARGGAGAVTAALRAFGRRPFRNAPAARRNELPGVALVDVSAGWDVGSFARGRLLVSASVENIGGVRWESVRGFPSAGRVWSAGLTIEPR